MVEVRFAQLAKCAAARLSNAHIDQMRLTG